MRKTFFLGLDLGQVQDFTALAVLEKLCGDGYDDPATYHVRHLERFTLGTPYPAIVVRCREVLGDENLRGKSSLVVDATGVGAPVVDLLKDARLKPVPVTITAGQTVNRDGGHYFVPKRDLVSTLQVLLQTERPKNRRSPTRGRHPDHRAAQLSRQGDRCG